MEIEEGETSGTKLSSPSYGDRARATDHRIDIEPELRKFDVPIFRVPDGIRKRMPSSYDPTEISFGPYHYEKEDFKEMEEVKRKYLSSFRKRNTNIQLADYFAGVRTIKDAVKACYEDLPKMEDGKFVIMMTRDAVALVEIIKRLTSDEEREKLGSEDKKEINAILRDMMLLENQIPFIVLEKIWQVQPNPTSLVDQSLQLMRDRFSLKHAADLSAETIKTKPLHLLHLFGLAAFPEENSSYLVSQAKDDDIVPRLSTLLDRGVNLIKNEQARGLKVSFSDGEMTMSPLTITGDTQNIFGNLIAFEQCYYGVALNASSYVVLMNRLLKDSADVRALEAVHGLVEYKSRDAADVKALEAGHGLVEHKSGHVDVALLFETLRRGVHDFKADQSCNPSVINSWGQDPPKPPTIFKVPAHIRNLKPDAYEPKIISFGPYHRDKNDLGGMKKRKWRYLNDLLQRYEGKKWIDCLGAVEKIGDEVRSCYQDLSGLGDADLLQIMTLDGCVQIEFVTRIIEKHPDMSRNLANDVQRDMMLLENQIPFIVLQRIAEYLDPDHGLRKLDENFRRFVNGIYSTTQDSGPATSDSTNPPPSAPVSQSLQLLQNRRGGLKEKILKFWNDIYPPAQNSGPTTTVSTYPPPNSAQDSQSAHSTSPTHLVDLLRWEMFLRSDLAQDSQSPQPSQTGQSQILANSGLATSNYTNPPQNSAQDSQSLQPPPTEQPQIPQNSGLATFSSTNPSPDPAQNFGSGESNSPVCSILGLAQLKEKGVKFVKSKQRSLTVSFDDGKMSINLYKISKETEVYLRNLIAFEHGYERAGKEASSYVVLMNHLIRTPEDVAVLSSTNIGILDNNLTSDEDVVHHFTNLCKGIDKFYRGKIYKDISTYVSSKPREWWREIEEKTVKSPLTFIGFTGAIILLLISIAQMVIAIFSLKKKRERT